MKVTPVELNNPADTSTAHKGLFSMITIGLQGGTRFVANWLIGLFAGTVVLGIVSNATALAFLLNTFWPSSAQSAASKFIARARGANDDAQVHAVARHIGVRVLQVVAVLSAAAPVWWYVQFGRPVWEGLCISAMLIAVATSQFARGVHFGAGQIARGTRVDILTSVVGLAGTGLLLALGVRDILLTLPLTIAMTVYTLLCWPWTAHGRPERALRVEIDKFVTFAALGSIASAGMLQVSQLTAGGIPDAAGKVGAAAGEYAAALQLVTPLSIIASALTLVMFPSMAQAQGAGSMDRLRRTTHLATAGFVVALVPILGALAIASRPVIELVWHGRSPQSAQLMPAFCVALLLQNVASPAIGSITSGPHKNMWFSLLLSWAGFLTALGCWAVLVPRLGILGVALGYAVGAAVTALSLIGVAWRLNGQRWSGLAVWLLTGIAAMSAISWWRQSQAPDNVLDIAYAAGYALVAAIPSVPMLRRLLANRR